MTGLAVRRATESDCGAIASLCVDHAGFEGGVALTTGLGEKLGAALRVENTRLVAWVACRAESVMGFASASPVFSTWQGSEFLHLDCLYLAPVARGQGGGIGLMNSVRAYAADAGYVWLEWQTPPWNAAAIEFYNRYGATATPRLRYSISV